MRPEGWGGRAASHSLHFFPAGDQGDHKNIHMWVFHLACRPCTRKNFSVSGWGKYVVNLTCDQLLWEEKQEENEETDLTLLAYSVFLIEFMELTGKLNKYPSLSRFVKLNLEHNVETRESSFSSL